MAADRCPLHRLARIVMSSRNAVIALRRDVVVGDQDSDTGDRVSSISVSAATIWPLCTPRPWYRRKWWVEWVTNKMVTPIRA